MTIQYIHRVITVQTPDKKQAGPRRMLYDADKDTTKVRFLLDGEFNQARLQIYFGDRPLYKLAFTRSMGAEPLQAVRWSIPAGTSVYVTMRTDKAANCTLQLLGETKRRQQ